MVHGDYRTLRVDDEAGVARVTIDNPPVNVLDVALIGQRPGGLGPAQPAS